MSIEIKAPAFPESVADGEIASWHKAEGDTVSRDELIVEIETDKVVMEVLAPEDGVITRIHALEGDTIQSEQVLATLEQGATAVARDTSASSPVAAAPQAKAGTEAAELAGPAARQLLEEHKIDPTLISGSGKGGRILKEDILEHLRTREAAPAAAAPVASAAIPDAPTGPSSERVEKRVPMTRMRARIAERLLNATQQTAMLSTFN